MNNKQCLDTMITAGKLNKINREMYIKYYGIIEKSDISIKNIVLYLSKIGYNGDDLVDLVCRIGIIIEDIEESGVDNGQEIIDNVLDIIKVYRTYIKNTDIHILLNLVKDKLEKEGMDRSHWVFYSYKLMYNRKSLLLIADNTVYKLRLNLRNKYTLSDSKTSKIIARDIDGVLLKDNKLHIIKTENDKVNMEDADLIIRVGN